jgi:hypothetical protein
MKITRESLPSTTSLLLSMLGLVGAGTAQTRPIRFLTPTQMPEPVNVAGSSSYSMALSADGLKAMVETDRPGGRGGRDVFLLQRPTSASSFTSYGPMGFCGAYDECGVIIWDNQEDVYVFSSNRPGGAGGHDLYGFGMGTGPIELNSAWDDTHPSISSDGLEFFFTSNRPGSLGGKSIWRSTRASIHDPWASPIALTSIDSANHEQSPSLTDDGLWIFFSSNRSGNFDIYAAARANRQSPFGAPVRVAELSGPNHEVGISLSNIGASGQDGIAMVTVMINGRAVILSAMRDGNAPMTLASTLSASDTVAPGELLSVHLRAPVGHYGLVLLGAPIAPVPTALGELRVHPAALMVLDAGVQADEVRLVQMLLPQNPHLRGVPIALQALGGVAPQLRLTNAVVMAVQ